MRDKSNSKHLLQLNKGGRNLSRTVDVGNLEKKKWSWEFKFKGLLSKN